MEEGDIYWMWILQFTESAKDQISCLNRGNTLFRLWKPSCSQTADEQPSAAKCARIESYGCIRWQPQDNPEGETSATLEETSKEMIDIFSQEGLRAVMFSVLPVAKSDPYVSFTSMMAIWRSWGEVMGLRGREREKRGVKSHY